jgi:nitrogen fixation/metabolism regulation signal transduction histidine kinase
MILTIGGEAMANVRTMWNKLSLKRKIIVMTLYAIILTVCILFFSMIVYNSVLDDYKKNMTQSLICYELQEALQEETTEFLSYTRERSAQNEEEMQQAFENTERIIENLPFNYEEIGEERYAITWNIQNGYAGYKEHRDSFFWLNQDSEKYVDELYRIIEMQEDMSEYALRLVAATLDQGNTIYEKQALFLNGLPWIMVTFSAVMMISIFLYFYRFARNLVEPMVAMAEDSRKMAEQEFQTPELETDREDEIGELIQAFNIVKGYR